MSGFLNFPLCDVVPEVIIQARSEACNPNHALCSGRPVPDASRCVQSCSPPGRLYCSAKRALFSGDIRGATRAIHISSQLDKNESQQVTTAQKIFYST